MDLPDGLLPEPWSWAAYCLYLPLLLWAILRAPWWRLRTAEGQHLFFGACALVLVLWSVRAGIVPGQSYHLLGASLLTLIFGWELALIILSLALLGITSHGDAGWFVFPVNALLMGALPVWLSYRIFLVVDKRLPNFFAYVLGCGFFGAGFALGVTLMGSVLLLAWASPTNSFQRMAHDSLALLPLLMIPEGFLNGSLTAILVGFKPHWVRTFRDERYIHGK
jgi:uncharacterized membrane protein